MTKNLIAVAFAVASLTFAQAAPPQTPPSDPPAKTSKTKKTKKSTKKSTKKEGGAAASNQSK